MELGLRDLTELYRIMLLSRVFEEKVIELFRQGQTQCYTPHLGIGEEAVSAGAFYGLHEDDVISPHYRGSSTAWFIRGLPPEDLMAIYMGRQPSGLGQYMVSQWSPNILLNVITSASSILGGPMELAVGVALAFKIRGSRQVVVNSFGDGTSNRGNFHEALNFAAVFTLPIVFVCQNNQWAMNMPVKISVPVSRIAERAKAYGFPGITVDGNDVMAVHATVQDAVDRARAGRGPTLIEALTYRVARHSERDNDHYRSEGEIATWKEKCPISRLRRWLENMGVSQQELEHIDEQVRNRVWSAVAAAQAMPPLTARERLNQMHRIYEEIYS